MSTGGAAQSRTVSSNSSRYHMGHGHKQGASSVCDDMEVTSYSLH
jgi:hypothetical protein